MIDQYPSPNGVLTSLIWRKTAAGGETSLSGYDNASQALSYTPGQEQVYLNGILLVRGDDYTATNGTSITGLSALAASDFVQVNCYNNFSVASLPTSGLTGTISNAQLQNSSITINGSAVSLGGSTTIAGGSAQDSAPTSPTEGQLWLDTDGTLSTTAFVEKSTINAKGDLYVGTADNTVGILSSGNSGETIVADNSATTGLRWQEPKTQNVLINSSFQVWQRGTSFTNCSSVYTADRWFAYTNLVTTGRTITRQTTGDTTNLPFIQYCARVARDSGNTSTLGTTLSQPMETVDSIALAGKTVTLSFYARRGANYSAASNALVVYLATGTGTDQNQQSGGYTGQALPISANATLTTTWQRFSFVGTIASNATEISPIFVHIPVGTAGAADYFEITGIQLEVGSVATPYRSYSATLAGELAACQRYYYRVTGQSAGQSVTNGNNESTTVATAFLPFPVTMRTAPTALEQTGTAADYYVRHQATTTNCSSVPLFANGSKTGADISFIVASGLTAGNGNKVGMNGTSVYLGWSAEL